MTQSTRGLRRAAACVLSGLVVTAGLSALAPTADAVPNFSFTRLAGGDRFDTAKFIATTSFGTSSRVLIARGDNFPDALAGNYMAGQFGVPLLLVRTDSIPTPTSEALTSLGATQATILGGTQAVSAAVESQLRSRGLTVDRVAGATRFDTAANVAKAFGTNGVGSVEGVKHAIVASGRNFPDALAAGPLAYAGKVPVLLTEPGSLSSQAASALSDLAIRTVWLVGGPAAVSSSVEDAIRARGITVTRVAGAVRQGTATALADVAVEKLDFSITHINLVRGDDFADALTMGPHSGKEKAPILLTGSPTILTAETRDDLTVNAPDLLNGHIGGGPSAVSAAVEEEARAAAASSTGGATVTVNQTTVSPGGTLTGTVTGADIKSVSVSGCGFTNTAVTRDATTGAFSLTVPSSQAPGGCELTFTTTFNDNTTDTDKVNLTVATPGATRGTGTAAPELTSVALAGFRTNGNGTQDTVDDFTQVDVRFNFDEAVTGSTPNPRLFFLWFASGAAVNACNTPAGACSPGNTAIIDPADTKSVLATFGTAALPMDANRFSGITTATVAAGAVTDRTVPTQLGNPEGNFPIQQTTVSRDARVTAAPDLLSIAVRGPGPNIPDPADPGPPPGQIGTTFIDFTFDENAFVTGATAGTESSALHVVLRRDGPGGAGSADITCTGPTPSSTTPDPRPNVQTGNGTRVITARCPITANGNQQILASDIARGYVVENGVSDARSVFPAPPAAIPPPAGNTNPKQAAKLGTSDAAQLVSAELNLAAVDPTTGAPLDTLLLNFNEPVFLVDGSGSKYHYYESSGRESGPNSASPPAAPTGPDGAGNPGDLPACTGAVQSSQDDRRIIVTCPNGSLSNAVGVSIDANAVRDATGVQVPPLQNLPDEIGITRDNVTTAAGFTAGPDLIGTELKQTRNSVGQVTGFEAIWRFDVDVTIVAPGPAGPQFFLYTPDGTKLVCTAATVPTVEEDDHTVRCSGNTTTTNFSSNGVAVGDLNRVVNSVIATVGQGAVIRQGSGGPPGNPEGNFLLAGSSGTPQA